MNIVKSITELVGNTPLMKLENIEKINGLNANIYAKLESFNPLGSIKDRTALAMILDAEKKGLLKPGAKIIEATSGNTGIGLAAMGAAMGYEVVIVMPNTMSVERQELLKALNVTLILTDGKLGMNGAIAKANEIALENEGSFMPQQFENAANPLVHYETTAQEIWNDLDGNVDIVVAGIGTGGTISGLGKYLKEKNPSIQVVGIEPENSPVLTKGDKGPHGIQGIGAGFVPNILDKDIIDEIQVVNEAEAYLVGKEIVKNEGFLVGISSSAALVVAKRLASRKENEGKNIVVIFPDTGERYLSTPLFK